MNNKRNLGGLGLFHALLAMGPPPHPLYGAMGHASAQEPKGERFEIDGQVVYALNYKSALKKAAKRR